jgi:hypothetical protein
VSNPIAKSVPTGVSGCERKGVIGQSSAQGRSCGQNNHGLAQHRPLSFDATMRLDDCISVRCSAPRQAQNVIHQTGSDFIGIAFDRAGLSKSRSWFPPFLGVSENFGILATACLRQPRPIRALLTRVDLAGSRAIINLFRAA